MKIIAAAVLTAALCSAARAQGPAPESPKPADAPAGAGAAAGAESAKSGDAEALAEAAVEGPGIEGRVMVTVACRVAAGKVADCDPANVRDPKGGASRPYLLQAVDEKVNIAPDWKNSLKPAARDSLNPAREKALVKKMRRLTGRLAYLNAAREALNRRLAEPGAADPAQSRKLREGRLKVEDSLQRAMHECSVLHGEMFDRAVLNCGAAAPAAEKPSRP